MHTWKKKAGLKGTIEWIIDIDFSECMKNEELSILQYTPSNLRVNLGKDHRLCKQSNWIHIMHAQKEMDWAVPNDTINKLIYNKMYLHTETQPDWLEGWCSDSDDIFLLVSISFSPFWSDHTMCLEI